MWYETAPSIADHEMDMLPFVCCEMFNVRGGGAVSALVPHIENTPNVIAVSSNKNFCFICCCLIYCFCAQRYDNFLIICVRARFNIFLFWQG